jgi:hypothetical protein
LERLLLLLLLLDDHDSFWGARRTGESAGGALGVRWGGEGKEGLDGGGCRGVAALAVWRGVSWRLPRVVPSRRISFEALEGGAWRASCG